MFWIAVTLVMGALGVSLRWLVIGLVGVTSFPWATLGVNILGSSLIGVLYAEMVARGGTAWTPLGAALAVGFLGGLTTYSSFSLDALRLMENGQWSVLTFYILAQNIFCISACGLSYLTARYFLSLS